MRAIPPLVSLPGLREGLRPEACLAWEDGALPKVRIVADYCSPGFQLADEDARAFGELPVGEDLLGRLADWSDRFERCDPLDYEDVCGMRFDFVAFAAAGLDIAKAVKRALPGWTVLYWDESLDWFLAREPRTYDPARSEYEVTLEDALAALVTQRPCFETENGTP